MKTRSITWLIVVVLAVAFSATLRWQSSQAADLRREADALREQTTERAWLEAEHARLVTLQPTEAELAALREDRAALEKLQQELQELQKARAPATQADRQTMRPDPPVIPAAEWKSVGRATPAATIETLLWARSHGNVDVIAAGLAFESDAARSQAESLLPSLPPEWGTHLGSPERLLALLAARDGGYDSLTGMQIVAEQAVDADSFERYKTRHPDATGLSFISVNFHRESNSGGPRRSASLQRKSLMMQRSFDGWKLVVPTAIIDSYAEKIRAGAGR